MPPRHRHVAAAWATALLIGTTTSPTATATESTAMDLGNFSVSLAVKDIHASLAFYEKLGFQRVGGDVTQRWVVLQNGNARIGLFQGMFARNMLTFNPGWTRDREALQDFQDVRDLQRLLQGRGLSPAPVADDSTEGPAHFMLIDPDGNPVLIDQHVPRPKR